ncbi:hypothetical protein O6H91_05G065700 [Diphasiastrum complanatum]|uniref:Uncharacterized protein n=1 Tax=Diphasiastrum complanatum TaxID=34168 RepID=A0ACC2DPC7_DIPCM|nr:hypothetical protein O6H91_05G065700 [Diphasiastrum complanatum]
MNLRLQRIVHTVQLAGGVMEELGNLGGSRADVVASQCREFMQSVKDIQVTLHEEIKSMCEYRPYENCDYIARIGAEISVNKLECVLDQLNNMQESIKEYVSEKPF